MQYVESGLSASNTTQTPIAAPRHKPLLIALISHRSKSDAKFLNRVRDPLLLSHSSLGIQLNLRGEIYFNEYDRKGNITEQRVANE